MFTQNFKKAFAAAFVLFIINYSLTAQTSIGFRAGLNLSKWNTEGNNDQNENITGTHFAIPLEIKMSNNFSIQPEFNFTQKGSRVMSTTTSGGITTQTDTKNKINYVEFPLLLRGLIGGERLGLYIQAGPSVGYAAGGSVESSSKSTIGGVLQISDKSGKYNFERSNRLDYGVHLGGGLQLGVGSNRLVIDVRYLYGLQDFDKDNNSVKVTNRGIALSAGLMLPF